MKVLSHSIIYDNPLPQLRSRQAAFPFLAQLGDGTVICSYQIGEAFESVDGTSIFPAVRTTEKPGKVLFRCSTNRGKKLP